MTNLNPTDLVAKRPAPFASAPRFILSALLGTCGLVGLSGSASAQTTEHASVCKPYGPGNSAVAVTWAGIYNISTVGQQVICPVVRTVAAGAGGFSVWVDGTAAAGSMSCTLSSFDYNGNFLGQTSFTATGVFDRLLTLPQAQVTRYSSQSVQCYLPVNGGLYDIEPVQ